MAFHGHQPQLGRQLFGRDEGMALQDRQQLAAHWWPHGGNAGEQSEIGFQSGMAIDRVVDVLLELGEFLIEDGDRVVNGLPDARRCRRSQGFFAAVMCAAQVLGNRFTACQQSLQYADFRGRWLPDLGLKLGMTKSCRPTLTTPNSTPAPRWTLPI